MGIDLEKYLQSKGVRVKQAGPDNIHCACFFCGEDDSKRGRLYIATAPEDSVGLFLCHLCGERGGLRKILEHFGDKPDAVSEGDHARHQILNAAARFYAENLHPEVLRWLKAERGLTEETVVKHQLGWAPSEDPTALTRYLKRSGFRWEDMSATGLVVERDGHYRDFLQAKVTIPYLVRGNTVLIRGKEMDGKYVTPPGQKTRLFNTDSLLDDGDVVCSEGEFDCLVLEQLGYNAVGCPGSNAWQETWNGLFEKRRVFIMFDPDEAGRKGAEAVHRQLGARARIVSLPVEEDEQPKDVDPSYLVVAKNNEREFFDELIKSAALSGTLLIGVDEAFEEWQGLQGTQGLKLGFEDLDVAIAPGLLPSQVMITLSKTGMGKSISLLNIFHRVAALQPDVKILFMSLEQTRGDWFERARRIWNFYNLNCPTDEVNKRTLDFWRPRFEMVDKNRVSEEQLLACIEEYELKHGQKPDLIAIDYLGYWAYAFRGKDHYEQLSNAVMSLKAVAKEKRVAIIAPHQVNRMAEFGTEFDIDSSRGSGVIEETGDFVITLWNPDSMRSTRPEDWRGEVHLKIGKSRHGGKGNVIKLQFAPLTLAMVPIPEVGQSPRELQLARDELTYMLRKDTWEEAIFRHKTGLKDGPISIR